MNHTDESERPDTAVGEPVAREALEAQLGLVTEQLPAHLWTTDAQLRVTSAARSRSGLKNVSRSA